MNFQPEDHYTTLRSTSRVTSDNLKFDRMSDEERAEIYTEVSEFICHIASVADPKKFYKNMLIREGKKYNPIGSLAKYIEFSFYEPIETILMRSHFEESSYGNNDWYLVSHYDLNGGNYTKYIRFEVFNAVLRILGPS